MLLAIFVLIIGYRMQLLILKFFRTDYEVYQNVFHMQILFLVLSFLVLVFTDLIFFVPSFVLMNLILMSVFVFIKYISHRKFLEELSEKLVEDCIVSLKMGESLETAIEHYFDETDAIKQHKLQETIKNVLFAQQIPGKLTASENFNSLLKALLICNFNPHKNLFILQNWKRSMLAKRKLELKKKNLTRQIGFQIIVGTLLYLGLFFYQISAGEDLLASVFGQISVTFFVISTAFSVYVYRRFS